MSKNPLLADESADSSAELDSLFDDDSKDIATAGPWRRRVSCILKLTEHLLLAACLCVIYILSTRWPVAQTLTDTQCGQQLSAFSPTVLLDVAVSEYYTQQFRGSLLESSKWKDPPSQNRPSKEVDEAWEIFKTIGAIRISEDDILALGKDPKDSVRWPAKYGGGYIGFVESLHMLHCLDFVRKMTFRPEYYGDDAYFQEAEFGIRRHADHCIDILRQSLMCTADAGVFSYVWVDRYPKPFPDFSVQHKCRNFDAVLGWAEENQVTNVELADLDRNGTRVMDGFPP